MKKAISLLLAMVLCMALCACGGNDIPELSEQEISKEEPSLSINDILENGTPIEAYEFFNEVNENIVRAELEYDGKVILFEDQIIDIQKDHIVVGIANTRIKVYLKTEDIIAVNKDQRVLVAGMVSNISLGQEYSLPFVSMEMQQGYLVQNHETDDEPLYKNAVKQLSDENFMNAIFILRRINDYADSTQLLMEAACKAAYQGVDSNKTWKLIFEALNTAPIAAEELGDAIVGDWYSSAKSVQHSIYTENGEFHFYHGDTEQNPDIPSTWYVENGRIVRESKYTRSEIVLFHFYENAYVFCYPRAYNKVTDDVYELHFLNGPLA